MKGGRGEGREIGQEGRKEGRKEGVTLVHLPVPNTCQNYVENNKSHLEGEKKEGKDTILYNTCLYNADTT